MRDSRATGAGLAVAHASSAAPPHLDNLGPGGACRCEDGAKVLHHLKEQKETRRERQKSNIIHQVGPHHSTRAGARHPPWGQTNPQQGSFPFTCSVCPSTSAAANDLVCTRGTGEQADQNGSTLGTGAAAAAAWPSRGQSMLRQRVLASPPTARRSLPAYPYCYCYCRRCWPTCCQPRSLAAQLDAPRATRSSVARRSPARSSGGRMRHAAGGGLTPGTSPTCGSSSSSRWRHEASGVFSCW